MWDAASEGAGSSQDDEEKELPVPAEAPHRKVVMIDDESDSKRAKFVRKSSLVVSVTENMLPSSQTQPATLVRKKSRLISDDDDRTDPDAARGHEAVRANLKRRQTARYEQLAALVEKANRKLEVAESRRLLLESSREEKVAAAWFSLMTSYSFPFRLDHLREVHKAMVFFVKRLAPCVRLAALRKRYKKRVQEAASQVQPIPLQIEVLLKDSLLAKFGEAHLRTVIPSAKYQFFPAGTSLVYEGEEGAECYAVVSGDVEIFASAIIDGKRVQRSTGTKPAGHVVGTIGMLISGERQTERVRCTTDVQAYVIHRKAFMSVVIDEKITADALAQVSSLHEANIPTIFAEMTSGEALAKQHLFSNVDLSVLNAFQQRMTPKVIRPGEIIISAGSLPTKMILILQGVVEFHKEARFPFSQPAAEVFANMADVSMSLSKDRKSFFQQNHADNAKGTVVGTLEPKTIIGGPMFLIMEPYNLTVVARTSVDAMIIDGSQFLHDMISIPISLGQMRRNACAAMAEWLRPLPRATLHQTVFNDSGFLALQALRIARHQDFEVKPVVINQGEVLEFGGENRDAYIIVSGSFEGLQSRLPVMWPSAPIVYFGNVFMSSRVQQRAEAWRMSRKSFISVLRHVLEEDKMNKLYVEMYAQYEMRTGKTPVFEEIRGIQINNPLLGAAPPAPPPDRSRFSVKNKSAADSKLSQNLPQKQPNPTSRDLSSVDAPKSTEANPLESEEAADDQGSRSRDESRASSRHDMAVESAEDTPDHPPEQISDRRLPILPATFRLHHGGPTMKQAMTAAFARQSSEAVDRRSPPRRTTSPTLPPMRIAPATARPAPPALPVEDPYTKLFGDTWTADYLRGVSHPTAASRSHRHEPLITSNPTVPSSATRHDVALRTLRRSKAEMKQRSSM